MRFVPSFVLSIVVLLPACAQETHRFRQWIAGTEAGGMEVVTTKDATYERIRHREWMKLERLGKVSQQEITQTSTKSSDGSLSITWTVSLSSEPMEGEARWSPKEPGILRLSTKGGKPATMEVPSDAVLWPGESEARLKNAAQERRPLHLKEFEYSTQQWSVMDLQPVGIEPLPGFPDAVRFKGHTQEGAMTAEMDLWISPKHGEIKHIAKLGGFDLLLQRAELPVPSAPTSSSGFFEQTLAKLPPHPFLPWIPEATLRWKGTSAQQLPEDDQQKRVGENLYRVRRSKFPSDAEALEMPVQGNPSKEDLPFLTSTSLLQFQDPAFNGLLTRMNPPKGASRWELAKRVTTFVFDWITEKDMSVGFASALEVAHTPKGDCTEHGVLAVALLRKLGVPARGAVGWVGLGDTMGLHFWVEVKLKDRWIPVDPTFDEAPASALRLKVATTDLANLGTIGWDTAALSFAGGAWIPEKPWADSIKPEGDHLQVSPGSVLRLPGSRWAMKEGHLTLMAPGNHNVEAVIRPGNRQLAGTKLLQGATSGHRGWWNQRTQLLLMNLGEDHWLQIEECSEREAFDLLDRLEARIRD